MIKTETIKRGDIIYVDLGQHAKSSVQSGVRPCVVVSNNKINNIPGNTVLSVCPFTGKQERKIRPYHIRVVPADVAGYFEKTSLALVEQTVPVDRRKIISKVGHITNHEVICKINHALMKHYELEEEYESGRNEDG